MKLHQPPSGWFANIGILAICEVCHRLIANRRNTVNDESREPANSEHSFEEFQFEDPTLVTKEGEDRYSMQPAWDVPSTERFGKVPLTPALMWEMMEGIREPIANSFAWTLLFLLLSVSMSPIGVGGTPPLNEDGTLTYAPAVLRGIPAWAMSILVYSAITTVIVAALVWLYPEEFPSDEKKLEPPPSRKANPHAFSMTAAELNSRSKYDARNETSDLRKSSLVIQRASAGVQKPKPHKEELDA